MILTTKLGICLTTHVRIIQIFIWEYFKDIPLKRELKPFKRKIIIPLQEYLINQRTSMKSHFEHLF